MAREVSGITFYVLAILFACGVVLVGYRDLKREYAEYFGIGGSEIGDSSLTNDLHGTYRAKKSDDEEAGLNSFLQAIAP